MTTTTIDPAPATSPSERALRVALREHAMTLGADARDRLIDAAYVLHPDGAYGVVYDMQATAPDVAAGIVANAYEIDAWRAINAITDDERIAA